MNPVDDPPEQPDQHPENSAKGLLLGFAAFVAFSFSDASVKTIQGTLSPIESAFFGALFAVFALGALLLQAPCGRLGDVFETKDRRLWLLRFIAYPAGVIGSVTAFTHLPMAEAFVLIFLQPAFVTVLSIVFLKERVSRRDWLAVILGFIGVLIVLRPGFRPLSIGHLGAIVAGLSGAISLITFRAAKPGEKPASLFGAGIVGGIVVCGLAAIPGFRLPNLQEWGLLAGYGLLAAFANVLMMHAARHARAAQLGPAQYSQMIWAVILGYFLFGDSIDLPTIIGIVFIVVSGLLGLFVKRASA